MTRKSYWSAVVSIDAQKERLMEESAARPRRHPLEVKPLSSNARFKQSRFEIVNPMPCKAYYVASSGGGKSSAAISLIENLLPLFTNFAVFSHTIRVDPSFDGLLNKIKRRLQSLDVDTEDPENEYRFENLCLLYTSDAADES